MHGHGTLRISRRWIPRPRPRPGTCPAAPAGRPAAPWVAPKPRRAPRRHPRRPGRRAPRRRDRRPRRQGRAGPSVGLLERAMIARGAGQIGRGQPGGHRRADQRRRRGGAPHGPGGLGSPRQALRPRQHGRYEQNARLLALRREHGRRRGGKDPWVAGAGCCWRWEVGPWVRGHCSLSLSVSRAEPPTPSVPPTPGVHPTTACI